MMKYCFAFTFLFGKSKKNKQLLQVLAMQFMIGQRWIATATTMAEG